MNLNKEDLEHCHMVLTSDIKECRVFIGFKRETKLTGGDVVRYEERIANNQRVIARIERILGVKITYHQIAAKKEGQS